MGSYMVCCPAKWQEQVAKMGSMKRQRVARGEAEAKGKHQGESGSVSNIERGGSGGREASRKNKMATGGVRSYEKQGERYMVCLCALHMNTPGR